MPSLTTFNTIRKKLMTGVLAAALSTSIGLQAAGAQVQPLWSVAVHFEYDNGFEFDYILARGVSTAEMTSILQDCGSSHWTGSVVRYHCYPIPE